VADLGVKSGGRWTEARWLRLGDHFLTKTGKSATVVGLPIRMERVQVYNLQVRNLQLYAVGSVSVLVHNSAIGRNMKDRVIPYAKERGYRYFEPDPNGPSVMRQNRNWLKQQMREGRWIYDIGEGNNPLPPSNFYDWERRFLERTRYSRCIFDSQP